MTRLRALHFLIHGFCYAEAARANPAALDDDSFRSYWGREKDCADRWREGVRSLAGEKGANYRWDEPKDRAVQNQVRIEALEALVALK